MAEFDYTYYKEVFGGELTSGEFDRFSPVATDVISILVGFDVSGRGEAGLLRALCTQTDYAARANGRGAGVKSESLGDYSVSYSEVGESGASLWGNEICPEALAALVSCGFLTRWA